MFSDERIDMLCGKIYRNGIFMTLCVTVLYLIGKCVTLQMHDVNCFESVFVFIGYFFCEITIITGCIIIFLYALLKFYGEKDERYHFETSKHYFNSAKILLVVGLSAYVLQLTFFRDSEYIKITRNYMGLTVVLETLAYVYIYYNFRKNGININYSFIFECKKEYYHRVWKNMLKFSTVMLIPYAIAAYFELLLNQSVTYMVSVLISYVISVLGLAMEYLCISFVEKRYYDDESSRILKNGTVVSCMILLTVMIFFIISQLVCYAITYNVFNISSPYVSLGKLLSISSYLKTNIDCIFITIMFSICFFSILPQIALPKIWLSGKITAYVLFAKVIWTYTVKPIYTEMLQSLLNNTSNYYFYITVNAIFNVIIEAIYIIALLISAWLFIKNLVNNYKVSPTVYAIPTALALYLVVYIVTTFAQLSSIILIIFGSTLTISSNVICFSALKHIDGKKTSGNNNTEGFL